MIYEVKITESGQNQYIEVPNELNQTMCIHVMEYYPNGKEHNYKFAEVLGKIDESLVDNEDIISFAEFIHPNLFFNETEATDEQGNTNPDKGKIFIDQEVFQLVNKNFIQEMFYLWSSLPSISVQQYLDKIEMQDLDQIYDDAVLQDIVE